MSPTTLARAIAALDAVQLADGSVAFEQRCRWFVTDADILERAYRQTDDCGRLPYVDEFVGDCDVTEHPIDCACNDEDGFQPAERCHHVTANLDTGKEISV